MNTKKYILAGALMLSLSTSTFAQSTDYINALNPIISAIETAPNDAKAIKDLVKNYQKVYKKDEKALVALGNVFLAHRDYAEATNIANLVVNNKKMNGSEGYLLLGDIAALQDSIGNAGGAATHYQMAINLDPHNIQAYERYAKVYRHINSDLAVQKLEELRKVKPDYPVEATAAEIMLGDGKYTEALNWYEKANTTHLTEDNFYKYSYTAYICQKYDKAVQVAKLGLQKFPSSEYIARVGMMGATEAKQYTDALNYAKIMFDGTGKKVANDYAVYGKALAGNNQYDAALQNLNKALELDPNNLEPLKTIADVYTAQGNSDQALEVLQTYLTKNKKANSNDWAKLAQAYMEKAEKATDTTVKYAALDKAIEVYDQMVAKFPSISDWIWLNQASAAQMKNDPDKVADIYMKVAAFEEAKPTLTADAKSYLEQVYYGLGYYHSKKGNKATADEYFKKVLGVNPNHEHAKKALGL